jgi:hypothetical protein
MLIWLANQEGTSDDVLELNEVFAFFDTGIVNCGDVTWHFGEGLGSYGFDVGLRIPLPAQACELFISKAGQSTPQFRAVASRIIHREFSSETDLIY